MSDNRFSDEWTEMVCRAWFTYEEAVKAASTAGYTQDPEIPNRTIVTDGEHSYALQFKRIVLTPGLEGLAWYWDSMQEDNL